MEKKLTAFTFGVFRFGMGLRGVSVETPIEPKMNGMLDQEPIHLWVVPLDLPQSQLILLRSVLSVDEQARANHLITEVLRRRYSATRGAVRFILANYLGISAQSVNFQYGPSGKPYLSEPEPRLKFNVAHSGDLAVCALTIDREIGVDLEQIRSDVAIDAVSGQFFAAQENRQLQMLDGDVKRNAFFICWTIKEAYLKAIGDGLSRSLQGFQVAYMPGEMPRLVHVDGNPNEAGRWSIVPFTPRPCYIGALAVEQTGNSPNFSVKLMDFNQESFSTH